MIPIKFKMVGNERITRKELVAAKQVMFKALGVLWHKRFRPKHFTRAGERLYGYTPRKGESGSFTGVDFRSSYTGIKLKKKGHTLPLVWSGLSQRLTRVRDLRYTSKGVKIVMNAPGFNRKNPNSKINMRDELTRVSTGEVRQIIALGNKVLLCELKNGKHARTRTKTIG